MSGSDAAPLDLPGSCRLDSAPRQATPALPHQNRKERAMSEDFGGRPGMTEGHRDPWSGPWSSPAEHRAATTLAAVDAFHAAFNREQTVEADPAEQLDQLRAERDQARRWAMAYEQRLADVRCRVLNFCAPGTVVPLLQLLESPLEVEQP